MSTQLSNLPAGQTIGVASGDLAVVAQSGTGKFVVRQPGGVAGTDEIQISHDGTNGKIESKDGALQAVATQVTFPDGSLAVPSIAFTNNSNVGFYQQLGGSVVFAVAGTSIFQITNAPKLVVAATCAFGWSSSTPTAANPDVSLIRTAAGVLKVGTASDGTGAGWIQNSAGESRVTSDVTNATTTMANITGLSATLISGRAYRGRILFACDDSTAADGIKFDLDGGTATMTSIEVGVTSNVQGAVAGVTVSTAIATDITFTAMNGTGRHFIAIEFTCVVNAGGTLIPRMSQVAHTTGTATVRVNTHMAISDIV